MNIIYTSIDNFKRKNYEIKSYRCLSENFCEWIEENTIKLLQKRTKPEMIASDVLKKMFQLVYEQPYFMIDGRSYFLDFFIPQKNVAVEIDGKYHKERKREDIVRDKDFKSIGIRTIRIKASDVLNGKFFEMLCEKMRERKKVRKKNNVILKKSEPKIIRAAMKRLREHDKMKHRAKWI